MISDLCLYLAGLFFTFTLQITAAYLACSLVTRTLLRPRNRFGVWLGFLSVAVIYWIGMVGWQLRSFAGHAAAGDRAAASSSGSFFTVPLSWSPGILIAGKVFLVAYVAAAAALLVMNAWRRLRLRTLLSHGWTPVSEIVALFDQIRSELGVARCELLVLPGLASPATVGWLRPRVLLPAVCEDLPESRLADVLHHELAHVARRDYFWAGVADLICRLLFFHPAVWRAMKLARFQGELACDLAVVEARPERRADYADSLAYFVRLRMLEEQAAVGVDFAASASNLGTRIRFILSGAPSLPFWKRIPRAAAALAVAGAFALGSPALTVSLGFFRPAVQSGVTAAPQPAQVVATRHRVRASNPQAKLPPVIDLSRLRTAKPPSGASEYALTRGVLGGHSDFGGLDSPWREGSRPANRPSVASVIRDSIVVAISRPERDRDKDHSAH
ncbi:MAG TPA: M56 family metallopeptidase [Candidatus Angelobacter sp.]|nr:M56 family metallopeptidase [Candidatus Angelobacter sp.]